MERGIGQTTIERLSTEGGALERVATGVYRIVAAPPPEHLGLRAAWLQLAPGKPAWSQLPMRESSHTVPRHRCMESVICQLTFKNLQCLGDDRPSDAMSESTSVN